MRFLSRNRAGDPGPGPAWAGQLRGDDVVALIVLLRNAIGPLAPQPLEFSTSADVANRYRLRELVLRLEGLPRQDWKAAVRDHLAAGERMRKAGDMEEASSQAYAQARPFLRLVPMRPGDVPPGYLAVPSLVPDIVEVLALDAGPYLRYVSQRLARRWDRPAGELVATADEQMRRIILERADRAAAGRPDVRAGFSFEPHSASFVRQLEHFVPGAGGILGTVAALPTRNDILYRDLEPGSDLRGDLVDLAVMAINLYEKSKRPVLAFPLWRRPDGTCRVVKFRFTERGDLLGSWDPAFDGVLTALDPLERLDVPDWAADLGAPAYTLFAGLVAAATAVWAEEVAILDEALALAPLADRCLTVDDERWPDIIAEYFETPISPAPVARALLQHPGPAVARIRSRLVATLGSLDGVADDAERRPTPLPGIVERLGLRLMDEVVDVPADLTASLGPIDELYLEAERQAHEALRSTRVIVGLAPRGFAMEGPGAAMALLKIGEWAPEMRGPGGVMTASSGDRWATIVPVDDVLAFLDLPGLIGVTRALAGEPARPLPPTLVWDGPTGRIVAQLDRDEDGIVRGARVVGAIGEAARALAMPTEPPFHLGDTLGKRWQTFLGVVRDEFVRRTEDDLTQLVNLRESNLREFAADCAKLREAAWPAYLIARLDEIALRRARLDYLSIRSTYEEARGSIIVRVAQGAGSISRRLPGDLRTSLYLSNPPRYRDLLRATIERWGVGESTCWTDAEANLLALDDLVEEPIPGGHPSWHILHSPSVEAEAAALYLHRRHPGTRSGFVISITQRGRAHFVTLDDRGAAASVGAFGQLIAELFGRARDAHDEHSSTLFWLMSDGSLIELYDALEPFPGLERLPPDFAKLVRRDLALSPG